MLLLFAGLLLWTIVHLIPSAGMSVKQTWIRQLGQNGYKLSFSLLIAFSLLLIVLGWRSSIPSTLYLLPEFIRPVAILMLVSSFLMLGAANQATRIKQYIRHPQLSGVITWAVAHLLLNGDTRSLLLFGWLGLWAALEIVLINNREGSWIKPAPPGGWQELRALAISLAIFFLLAITHPYFTGVGIGIS